MGSWCWLCWAGQRPASWGLLEPGLGRLPVRWGLLDCGPAWESGLPVKEALLPVTRVSLGETRVQGMASTGYLAFPGAVTRSGTQAVPVVVWVATSERAIIGGRARALGHGAPLSRRLLHDQHGGIYKNSNNYIAVSLT